MKTSKIIFISFFSILGLFLLSLMIEIPQETKFFAQTYALPHFSHLVVKGKHTVNIILANQSANSDSLSFNFLKADDSSEGLYQTKGDTLFIDVQSCDNVNNVLLNCLKIPEIDAKNAQLFLSGDTSVQMLDSISIVANSSRIDISDKLSFLNMNLILNNDSRFYGNAKKIENLTISLNYSQCYFYNAVINQFKGTLTNNSLLNIDNAEKLEITADKSSKYYILPN